VRDVPELLEHGRYAAGLDRFTKHFPRESVHVAVFDDLSANPQGFLDDTTDFLNVTRMPLSVEEQQPTLAAAAARNMTVAHAARRMADFAREHGAATVIGLVKRSPLVHKVLYRPIDKSVLRPAPDAVDFIKTALIEDVRRLDSDYGQDVIARWGWT
jgi:hypothetical protein